MPAHKIERERERWEDAGAFRKGAGQDCESQSVAMPCSSMKSVDPDLGAWSGEECGGVEGALSGQMYAAVFTASVCCSLGSSRMGIFCVTASKDFGQGEAFVDPVLL